MISRGQFLQGRVVVVDQREPQVVFVTTVIIRTAVPEVFAQASAAVPLFVRIVARRAVNGKTRHR